jgi:hypothetical protein
MPENGQSVHSNPPHLAVRALSASVVLAGLMVYATAVWADPSFSFPIALQARWLSLLFFAVGLGLAASLIRRRGTRLVPASPFEAAPMALFCGLSISLFSSAAAHPWFFIERWFQAGHGLRGIPFALVFAILTTAGTVFLLARPIGKKGVARILALMLVAIQAASLAALFRHTDMAALYGDDHSSFMFRIREFVETYPAMTVFNPWWNAGVVNAVGASSGVGAVALPLFPLWKAVPVHLVYTPALGLLFVVIAPLLTLAGLRAVRASWLSAVTGAILSLCVSRATFVWGLHFGTVGAVFSMQFLPLFALLLYRAAVMRRPDIPTLCGLVASAFFLAQWPPCLIMALLLVPGLLLNVRRLRRHEFLRLLAAAAVTLLLLLPNIAALLSSRDLFAFVAESPSPAQRNLPPLRDWLRALPAMLSLRLPEANPLVTFLGLGGLFVLPLKRLQRMLLPAVIGLLLLAAWGPLAAPRLQFERMALPALMLASIPAAILAGKTLASKTPSLCAVKSAIVSLLFLCGVTTIILYGGGGYAPYRSLPQEIRAFAEKVHEVVPQDGRLLFYGSTVHSFGGGHVAYLPILAKREMMACDYYHFPPKMVEYDYPPKPWRKTAEGIADFMRLHGATHLATTIPHRAAFIRDSGFFTEIPFMPGGKPDTKYGIALFALKGATGGRALSGDVTLGAKVVTGFDYLPVFSSGLWEGVLRYNWNPHLTAGGDADLEPVEVAPGVTFIRVRFTGNDAAVIRYGRDGK